jgi:glycerol-3-phosphate dehydrogenase subunit B
MPDVLHALRMALPRNRFHPYHLLGNEAKILAGLSASVELVRQELARAGHPLAGTPQDRVALFNTLGTFKASSLCHQNHYHVRGDVLKKGIVGVIGIAGHAGFVAKDFVPKALSFYPEFMGWKHATIHFEGLAGAQNLTNAAVAHLLEDDRVFQYFADSLERKIKELEADRVVLPPVLGISKATQRIEELNRRFKLPVGELLGAHHSIPGYRLSVALEKALRSAGVTVLEGEAVATRIENAAVRYVEVNVDGKHQVLAVDQVLLATGKFLGGGLRRETSFRETLFNLPVWSQDRNTAAMDILEFTDPNPLARQALFEVGVRVDDRMRPLKENGKVLAGNLFAAGSILRGYNFAAEKCGAGVALATGYAAAMSAVGAESAHA